MNSLPGEPGAPDGDGSSPRRRSARKRQSILDAAFAAFVSTGFDATSMDDVARVASVSKPTIYGHFGDKAGLFRAAILAAIEDTAASTHDLVATLPATQDLPRDLQRFARRHLADLMDPNLIRIRRRIIAEAERFPDLAATWYDNGPAAGIDTLATIFSALHQRGLLRVDNPIRAGEQFNWLVLIPLNRAMFVIEPLPEPYELERAADDAVAIFLAAYSTDQ